MPIAPGSRLRRYEVGAPLGAGGMGEVYLARDVELDRTVALKVLSDAPDEDGERMRRFIQEARAAISLNHPNVAHIYDVGEERGVRFMAMEYVEGETLRARMRRQPLTFDEAAEIGTQIAAALASAHALGIVHRDIKPENVMIRPDGYVKVLDFGLAKLTSRGDGGEEPTMVVHTAPGLVMGTMQYMSPEQLRTDDVDARSDVFSLGVMLYEMVMGKRPFDASTPSGVIAAILTDDPAPLDAGIPPGLRTIVDKALSKKREDRYASARELLEALKASREETKRIHSGDVPTQMLTRTVERPRRAPWKWIGVIAVLLTIIAAASFFAYRAGVVRRTRAKLPQLEKLVEDRRYFAAWDLAESMAPHLGDDAAIARAMERISGRIDVKTEPSGAQVYLERIHPDGSTGPRMVAGATPLSGYALPLGDYIVRAEKEGFAPRVRTIALAPLAHPAAGMLIPQRAPKMEWTLAPAKDVPAGMVRVDGGGRYRIVAWSRPTNEQAALDDFFIDQFEVTNREFKQFIDGGGYERRELWKHPFVRDGKTLSFEEAMQALKDTTDLNAPRRWVNQNYPVGRDEYPVTDVTWYEAAAYAEFRGKTLPTLYQWDKAARDGITSPFAVNYPWGPAPPGSNVARRANFRGGGTMPVTSLPSGMSAFGIYHMAGNVSEWCLNRYGDGMTVLGGDFNSPVYAFGNVGSVPPMHSSQTIGFRCTRVAGTPKGDQGAQFIPMNAVVRDVKPVSDAEFAKLVPLYGRPNAPLNARVVERRTTAAWTKEKIEFDAANGERTWAFLYLPRHARPPYQIVHIIPASDVHNGLRALDESMEDSFAGRITRGGRGVFGVVVRGYIGRTTGDLTRHPMSSPEFGDRVVEQVTDLRRGLDYLTSRPDVDSKRIGLFGPSAGSWLGIIAAALEDRYGAIIFSGLGFSPDEVQTIPYASRVNFAPRIRAPKLMLHGRWDEAHPLQTEAMPAYRLLSEPKRLVVVDAGHIPTADVFHRVMTEWFDERLGKVPR